MLRRVKVIEVEHLPVSLVADVLKKRYKKNATAMSMIEPVLKLYHTSVMSKMDKPATIDLDPKALATQHHLNQLYKKTAGSSN